MTRLLDPIRTAEASSMLPSLRRSLAANSGTSTLAKAVYLVPDFCRGATAIGSGGVEHNECRWVQPGALGSVPPECFDIDWHAVPSQLLAVDRDRVHWPERRSAAARLRPSRQKRRALASSHKGDIVLTSGRREQSYKGEYPTHLPEANTKKPGGLGRASWLQVVLLSGRRWIYGAIGQRGFQRGYKCYCLLGVNEE